MKEIMVLGTNEWLGVQPHYTDDEIREYLAGMYDGWGEIEIKRQTSVVLVRPVEETDE